MNKRILIGVLLIIVMLRISYLKFGPTYDYLLRLDDRGDVYDIRLEKNEIEVDIASGVVCTSELCQENYKVDLNSKNIDRVYDLFAGLFPKNEKKMALSLQSKKLTLDQIKILIAIVRNDPEYIDTNKIELESDPREITSYSLISSRIDCNGVILKLYDDYTYKYIYSMTDSPRAGNLEFDIQKLIDNLNRYDYTNEEDSTIKDTIGRGAFYLDIDDDASVQYTIYDDNEELKELLSELDLNLDVCMQE